MSKFIFKFRSLWYRINRVDNVVMVDITMIVYKNIDIATFSLWLVITYLHFSRKVLFRNTPQLVSLINVRYSFKTNRVLHMYRVQKYIGNFRKYVLYKHGYIWRRVDAEHFATLCRLKWFHPFLIQFCILPPLCVSKKIATPCGRTCHTCLSTALISRVLSTIEHSPTLHRCSEIASMERRPIENKIRLRFCNLPCVAA